MSDLPDILTPDTPPQRVTWATLPRGVQLITLAFILANLGGSMFYDQLAVYLTKELNAGVQQVGVFFVYAALVGTVTRILGGWISDAIGHFRGIAIGSVIGFAGAALMWWAPTWQLAMLCYTFNLAGMSLVGPSATAAITELTPPSIRSRTFGITSGVFQIVSVVGPLVGGYVIANAGWRGVLLLNAILMLAATIMRSGLTVFETQTLHRPRWRGLVRDLRWFYASIAAGTIMGIALMIDILTDFQSSLAFNLRSLYLEEVVKFNPQMRGLLFTVSGVAAMPAMILGGILGDRIGEIRTMLLGVLAGGIGYLLFPYQTTLLGYAIPFALWGIMGGMFEPNFRALISKVTPRERLATAFGTIIGSTNLVSFPAAHLGPWLYDRVDPHVPFVLAGVMQLLVFVAMLASSGWLTARVRREQQALAQAEA